MSGVIVDGPSCFAVGDLLPKATREIPLAFLPLVAGMSALKGIVVVDTHSGQEFPVNCGKVLVVTPSAAAAAAVEGHSG